MPVCTYSGSCLIIPHSIFNVALKERDVLFENLRSKYLVLRVFIMRARKRQKPRL